MSPLQLTFQTGHENKTQRSPMLRGMTLHEPAVWSDLEQKERELHQYYFLTIQQHKIKTVQYDK